MEFCPGSGKIIYASRLAAWRGYLNTKARTGKAKKKREPYECSACGGFHFGHEPRRARQVSKVKAWRRQVREILQDGEDLKWLHGR